MISFHCLGANGRRAERLSMKCSTRGCGCRSSAGDLKSWELAQLVETGKANFHSEVLADAWREDGQHVPWEITGGAGKTDSGWEPFL